MIRKSGGWPDGGGGVNEKIQRRRAEKKTRPHFMTQTYFTFKEKKKKKRKREWKKREKRRRARAKVQISNGENI